MTGTRVLIAEDALLVREGVHRVLVAAGFDVVAEVGSAPELDRALQTTEGLELLVLDISMPPGGLDEGLSALERLRAAGSRVPALLLSARVRPALALRAVACGPGTGYLLKQTITRAGVLPEALRELLAGRAVLDPLVVESLVSTTTKTAVLSPREHQVLGLMAQGRSNAGIARQLQVSVKTIETHVEHVFIKLDLLPAQDDHRRVLAVLAQLRATA